MLEKTDKFIQTYTGARVTMPVPRVEEINIIDIAHALSLLCRFTGHTEQFYSVAEHCIRVAQLVEPKDKLAALLHDASEAYLGDISTPLKEWLPEYKGFEQATLEVIYKAFNVTGYDLGAIKKADSILCMTEARDLLGSTNGWSSRSDPLPSHIVPWSYNAIEPLYLAIFRILWRAKA